MLLERKIGSKLEKATLDDLLIPSYSYLNETLYDIDLVERLLGHFLEISDVSSSLTVVGKLIDGVLGEIASDANLKPEKFYNLVVSLPDEARLYDDGLYRAISRHIHGCWKQRKRRYVAITGTLILTSVTEVNGDETVGEGNVDFWIWEKTVRENQFLR